MIAESMQRRLANGAQVVFDVGAERGRYSRRYLEMFPKAIVYAFEPAPIALTVLNKLDDDEPRFRVIPMAVLDRTGEIVFKIASADVLSSILDMLPGWTEHRMVDQIVVPTITLDGFCDRRGIDRVDVLKIDVQGAELLVLKGAVGVLAAGIRVILCELGYLDRYVDQCWHYEVKAFLSCYGYRLEHMVQFYQDGRLLRADGVFIR